MKKWNQEVSQFADDDDLDDEYKAPKGSHNFDDDECCKKCGFDGAEWHWWKHHTYEGKASSDKMPRCSS